MKVQIINSTNSPRIKSPVVPNGKTGVTSSSNSLGGSNPSVTPSPTSEKAFFSPLAIVTGADVFGMISPSITPSPKNNGAPSCPFTKPSLDLGPDFYCDEPSVKDESLVKEEGLDLDTLYNKLQHLRDVNLCKYESDTKIVPSSGSGWCGSITLLGSLIGTGATGACVTRGDNDIVRGLYQSGDKKAKECVIKIFDFDTVTGEYSDQLIGSKALPELVNEIEGSYQGSKEGSGIPILGCFISEDKLHLVMEPGVPMSFSHFYMSKESRFLDINERLFNLIVRRGPQSCIHGDIKSTNIAMIGNKLKLIDYGACRFGNGNMHHRYRGTMEYSPPDMEVNKASSVWAMGLTAYKVIVGSLPGVLKEDAKQSVLAFHQSREEVVADPKLAEWPNCMLKLIFSRRIKTPEAFLDVLETYRQEREEGVLNKGHRDILPKPPKRSFSISQCFPTVRSAAIRKGSGS